MTEVTTTGSAGSPRPRGPLRSDRVYIGWRFRQRHADPGPPPRRPTPPPARKLDPDWVAAQRREENLLNRPLKLALGVAAVGTAVFVVLLLAGALNAAISIVGLIACVLVAGVAFYALWQGEMALRSRVADEEKRLAVISEDRERKLRAAHEEHAEKHRTWQSRRAAFERQDQWYAVTLPREMDRVDVAGGTLTGWSALATVVGATRLSAGGELTVIDLTEGSIATDLISYARRSGIDEQVWVLPSDLPRLDLGLDLPGGALADVLSLVVSVSEEQQSARDLSVDNSILERLLDVLGGDGTRVPIASLNAALRALEQAGDPRDDLRGGLIDADKLERIGTMFGRTATDRVVLERAWALESQLRKLDRLGTEAGDLPHSRLRVLATDRRAGVFGNRVLGSYVVTALTHVLRGAPAGDPWRHTVMLYGAEKLRGDVLDRLTDACESTGTGLLIGYRSIGAQVKERLGRGNAAVAFMRLGNADDAKAASEHIGQEHRFVLGQVTETVGTSLTDTTGDSYTSTVGTSESTSTSTGTSQTSGSSRSRGRNDDAWLGFGDTTWSRGKDSNTSSGTNDSESFTDGINESTSWGKNTSSAIGSNESTARTLQRSREYLVEQHELQQLPVTALIMTHATASRRRVILADANPAIVSLPNATTDDPDAPALPAAATPPIPAQPGLADDLEPPPNLGPPPDRLDWR